jgi:hypothetical protein
MGSMTTKWLNLPDGGILMLRCGKLMWLAELRVYETMMGTSVVWRHPATGRPMWRTAAALA